MSSYSVTLQRIGKGSGHAVVIQADPVIWIAPDVLAQAATPPTIPGGLERDGDLLTFGTEGEGLGRLTYRITGKHRDEFGHEWTVAEREEGE